MLILAVSPIEVVDLFPGAHFVLTPFLAMSVIYIPLSVVYVWMLRGQESSLSINYYLFFLLSMIVLSGLSVIFSGPDPLGISLKRFLYFSWILFVSGMFLLVVREHLLSVFVSAFKLFLVFSFLAVVIQWLYFKDILHFSISWYDVNPWVVGGFPRYNGVMADPNRFAVTVSIFLGVVLYQCLLIGRVGRSLFYMFVSALLVGLAVSRTGLVAYFFVVFGFYVSLIFSLRWRFSIAASGFVLLFSFFFLAAFSFWFLYYGGEALLYKVFFGSPARVASTNIHLSLLSEGIKVSGSSLKNLFLGVGWGTSYYYVSDFFGSNKYGNFHSQYISFLVQSGFLSLVGYCLLMVALVFSRVWYTAIAVGVACVFYEFQAEPTFWIILGGLFFLAYSKQASLTFDRT
ncbi:MAG: hypothetical protein P8015_14795 [Acidihalobacter sp.]